jgi:hypothetical protein
MQLRKKIKLLTLNVFLRPPPIKHNADDFKEERFAEILKLVEDYDILCFEEMFQTGSFRPERMIDHAIDHSTPDIIRVLLLENELTPPLHSWPRR